MKFKVWDKKNKKMLHNGFIISPSGKVHNMKGGLEVDWSLLYSIEGSKDIHGKEAFLGDIIVLSRPFLINENHRSIITYIYLSDGGALVPDTDSSADGSSVLMSDTHEEVGRRTTYEIIGNVFEHEDMKPDNPWDTYSKDWIKSIKGF